MDNWDERWLVANAMIKFGGCFASHLGQTLIRADLENTRRIKSAFPHYWEKYLKLGIEHKLGEEDE